MLRCIIFLIAFTCSFDSFAKDSVLKTNCKITPNIWDLQTPPKINNTNNLRRKTGTFEIAQGDFITIEGRVFDEYCVPISGATVEIWHVNSMGINNFTSNDYANIDNNFVGSGKTITDNLGRYKFITIFPGAEGDTRAPHVNFRVKHKDFLPIETEMFFENQANNYIDSNLISQVERSKRHLLVASAEKADEEASDDESIKYNFDIVIEGRNKYRRY